MNCLIVSVLALWALAVMVLFYLALNAPIDEEHE